MKYSKARKGKGIFGRISGYTRAFIVLLAVFLVAGFCTIGSARSTGKSFTYTPSGTTNSNVAVFDLSYTSGSKLAAVYVNIGNVYAQPGTSVNVQVYRYSSTSSSTSYQVGDTLKLNNIYGTAASTVSGGNFNWVPVATDKSLSAVSVSIKISAPAEINEIVCLAEDGSKISLSVNTDRTQGFSDKKALEAAIDAQDSFTAENSSRYNFTQEEAWYMTSVHTVLGGRTVLSDAVYSVDNDFNALATAFLLPSVAIFGDSPFALRLTPMLATAAALVFVFLFGRLLFKDDKYGFVLALLFAIGGLATTVGRLGAPYALLACFLIASAYFMYRFFAKGIAAGHTVRGGLNILFSGLFSALALAMNTLAIFPVAAILVLFAFGMRRQSRAYALAAGTAKTRKADKKAKTENAEAENAENASGVGENEALGESAESGLSEAVGRAESLSYAEESEERVAEETESGTPTEKLSSAKSEDKVARRLRADYAYKRRVSWAFAGLSFVLGTLIFLLIGSVIGYTAYVKAFDTPADPSLSYGALLWKGISAPFKIGNVTEYTAANASNVIAWLLPLKAATVYDGILPFAADSGRYLAWNVSVNAAMSVVSLFSFAFCTVTVISDVFSEERGSLIARRIRRTYLVLLAGLVSSMLMYAFVKNVSAVQGLLFSVFYVGFMPLAMKIVYSGASFAEKEEGEKKRVSVGRRLAKTLPIVCLIIFVVFFLLSLPGMYGFEISSGTADWLFGWMSVFNNGYYRG